MSYVCVANTFRNLTNAARVTRNASARDGRRHPPECHRRFRILLVGIRDDGKSGRERGRDDRALGNGGCCHCGYGRGGGEDDNRDGIDSVRRARAITSGKNCCKHRNTGNYVGDTYTQIRSTDDHESRIIFIIGKRHTGKSVLMKDLLYHMPRPDYVLAMAPTRTHQSVSILCRRAAYSITSHRKLERTVTLQRELVNRGRKRTVLIILDDCLYQYGFCRTQCVRFSSTDDTTTSACVLRST